MPLLLGGMEDPLDQRVLVSVLWKRCTATLDVSKPLKFIQFTAFHIRTYACPPWKKKKKCRLDYDPATDSYANASGVEVRAPGFGETGSVENLANDFLQTFTDMVNAFEDMVDYFEDRGYEVGKTIRAAPYDWRLAAGIPESTWKQIRTQHRSNEVLFTHM